MNASRILWILTVGIAAALGWYLGRNPGSAPTAKTGTAAPRILYYQSSMHPWIKSDRPGKCTICGMDLAPVFEGQAGFTGAEGVVTLSTNSVTVSHVQTSPVVRQPVVRTVPLNGSMDDDDSRHRILSARVEGRIERLFVNFTGAEVRAGEPLALVYSPSLLTAVREYLALLKGPAGSGPIRDAAALRLAQLGLLPRQVESLPGTFSDTNLTLEILSPMTGTVVAKTVFEGQALTVGQPLFEIADFDTLWLKLQVYENDLGWLRPGQPVEITSPALPGIVLTNAITFIDPNFNAQTRSTLARVEIPNPLESTPSGPRRRIPHRVLAEARVRVASEPTLTIPRSAVLDSGQPLAYVELGNGAYEPRALRIGLRGDREVEVTSGLAEGERVVTQGALLLDAQAQLHQLVQPQTTPSATLSGTGQDLSPNPGQDLSPEQTAVVADFLKRADAVREALSSDSLADFNAALPGLHEQADHLSRTLTPSPVWSQVAARVVPASHLEPAPDLESARKEFHRLSEPVVALGRLLRPLPTFSGLKLYECPMTRRAFPGAPQKAAWFQLGGPVRNPYFGAEMLDCGMEVRP